MLKNKNTKSKNTKNKMFNNQDILKDLESEFTRYLQEEGWHAYLHLPEETQDKIDRNLMSWVVNKDLAGALCFGPDFPLFVKQFYLAQMLLPEEKLDFVRWTSQRGYEIEKIDNHNFRLLNPKNQAKASAKNA